MATRKASKGDTSKAIGYLRVSKSDGSQELGPLAQRAAIEKWASANKVTIVAWHEDHITGGSDLSDRPALVAALGELRAAGAGILVVLRRDRLARDVAVAATIERAVESCGARVVTADGVANGDTPADGFLRTILDAAAAYEKSLIQARTRAALAAKRAKGERTGTVRFGCRLAEDGVRLVEDEGEQSVIRLVREHKANGRSIREIVAALESAGVKSRVGKPLAITQVGNILRAS